MQSGNSVVEPLHKNQAWKELAKGFVGFLLCLVIGLLFYQMSRTAQLLDEIRRCACRPCYGAPATWPGSNPGRAWPFPKKSLPDPWKPDTRLRPPRPLRP